MSIQHVSNVFDTPSLSSSQTLVMAVLADHASPGGIAWPGMKLLGERTKMTQPTLRGHIKSLVDEGWLKVLAKGNGRGVITRYALNVDRLECEAQAVRATRKDGKETDWFPEKGEDSYPFSDEGKGERIPPKGESFPQKGERIPPKGESHGSTNRINRQENHSKPLVSPKPARGRVKVWEIPIDEEGWGKLRTRFPHLDVQEEAAIANAHEARFKSSDEYLYLLNWMKKAPAFPPPRSAAGTVAQPSSAALHNPVPKSSFEDQKARDKAAWKAAREKGFA